MQLFDFQDVGRKMFARGLICNQSGNLSIVDGSHVCITRRGSSLDCLESSDLVHTGIEYDDHQTPVASSELAVHRTIYRKTNAKATVHSHPVHTIALSYTGKEIIPLDMEGQLILGKVPVIGEDSNNVKPGGFADEIAEALMKNKIIVVRGHGSFAIGQSLQEAFGYTVTLEHCCHILYLVKTLGLTSI